MAPPRGVARESPMLVEIRFSGASGGKSILRELDGSSGVSCALSARAKADKKAEMKAHARTAVLALLKIDIIDGDRSRFAVDVACPNIALGTYRLVGRVPVVV